MGLRKDLETKTGLFVRLAYFRIDVLSVKQDEVNFNLMAYVSREDFLNGKDYLQYENYSFKPDMSEEKTLNIYKQAYAYIKNLEEYKNAIDVLENGQVPLHS